MTSESRQLAAAFEAARDGRSMQAVRDGVYDRLGPYTPTPETIRTYHKGTVKNPDPIVVWALANYYDIKLDTLPARFSDTGNRVRDVLSRLSTWIAESAALRVA